MAPLDEWEAGNVPWPADPQHEAPAKPVHLHRDTRRASRLKQLGLLPVEDAAAEELATIARRTRRVVQQWAALKRKHLALAKEFGALADDWERETRRLSSPNAIAKHPSARKIVALGRPAVPLILQRMKHRPWFWFGILMELTGEAVDPVTPSMHGDLQKMTDAWLQWGIRRGHIS